MMKFSVPPQYKPIVAIGLLIILGFIGFSVYQSLQFRITGTTPDFRNYPASLGVMDIKFNRNLDTNDLESRTTENVGDVVGINFEGTVTAKATESTLRVTFSQTPLPGKYEVTLKDIKAADGTVLNKKLNLVVKDIPYDKLSDEEKALFNIDATNAEGDDAVEFPILSKLPHETDGYLINYMFEHSDPVPTLIITVKAFPPGNNAVPATDQEQAAYLNDIRSNRTAALAWLQSEGASPEDYVLNYTETEIRDEFPAGRGRYYDGEGDTPEPELEIN